MIDSELVGSTDFHSSHPQGHGRDVARANNAQGTPARSNTSPSILVYEEHMGRSATRAEDAEKTPTESYITKYTSVRRKHDGVGLGSRV